MGVEQLFKGGGGAARGWAIEIQCFSDPPFKVKKKNLIHCAINQSFYVSIKGDLSRNWKENIDDTMVFVQ